MYFFFYLVGIESVQGQLGPGIQKLDLLESVPVHVREVGTRCTLKISSNPNLSEIL